MGYFLIDVTPKQLQLARKILGLTQESVCEDIKISVPSYRAIESGKSDPKLSNFRKAVHYYSNNNIIFCKDGNNVKIEYCP